MRDGVIQQHDLPEVLFGRFDPLADRRRHFFRFADAEPDYLGVAVADHDER